MIVTKQMILYVLSLATLNTLDKVALLDKMECDVLK